MGAGVRVCALCVYVCINYLLDLLLAQMFNVVLSLILVHADLQEGS